MSESVRVRVDLDCPFRGSAAVAAGLLTRDRLYGRRFRRVLPDVYVPATAEPDLRLRSRAAALYVGGRGVLVGYSATTALRTAYDLGRRPDRTEAVVAIDALHRELVARGAASPAPVGPPLW